MKLDQTIAQSIVNKMMETIPYNINIMNEGGYIIASGDKSRINTLHVGALDTIESGQTLPMIQSYGTHGQPGVNMPVKFQNETIGVVGITGDPETVIPLASLLKVSTELLISQNYNNHVQQQYKNRLNSFLYRLIEVKDDIEKHPTLISEAKNLQINVLEKRDAIVIETANIKNIKLSDTDFLISLSPERHLILTSHEKSMKNYLSQAKQQHLSIGIGTKSTELGESLEQAERTIRIAKTFTLSETYFYKNIRLIDQILSKNIHTQNILDSFGNLDKSTNGRELIDTLAAYFKANGNVTVTSELLHIHRNTTNYRLNKLAEFFNLDIHNLNDVFELYTNYLSFKDSQYQNK